MRAAGKVKTLRHHADDLARRFGRYCLVGTSLAIGIVSLWTPLADAHIAARWFSTPNIFWLAPVPLITAGLIWYEWRSLGDGSEYAPFFAALGPYIEYFEIVVDGIDEVLLLADLDAYDAIVE